MGAGRRWPTHPDDRGADCGRIGGLSDWPIRQLIPEHLPSLTRLWHEAHAAHDPADPTARRSLAEFTARLHKMAPASRTAGPAGAPLGYCSIKGDEIDQIYLAPVARGTGFAAALLADAETRLADQGVSEARLACVTENTRAIRFYEREGWTKAGPKTERRDTSAGPFPLRVLIFTKHPG